MPKTSKPFSAILFPDEIETCRSTKYIAIPRYLAWMLYFRAMKIQFSSQVFRERKLGKGVAHEFSN
jgi:hypothetical protein